MKFYFYTILFFSLSFLLGCDSKYVYLTSSDKIILEAIEKEDAYKLLDQFADNVEFDYGSEASMMFSLQSDKKDFVSGTRSEYYRFIFGLDEVFREKSWLSFKDALIKAYRVQGENNEVNDDKSYNRSIHIYTEKSYNRINLRCIDESQCKIYFLHIASSRI